MSNEDNVANVDAQVARLGHTIMDRFETRLSKVEGTATEMSGRMDYLATKEDVAKVETNVSDKITGVETRIKEHQLRTLVSTIAIATVALGGVITIGLAIFQAIFGQS